MLSEADAPQDTTHAIAPPNSFVTVRVACDGCGTVIVTRATRALDGIIAGSLCRACSRPGAPTGHARWAFR